jgi:hypothetical protein
MELTQPCNRRRIEAANAPDLRRFRKVIDILFSIAFAGLLGVAVWKLDNAPPQTPTAAGAPSSVPLAARTRALIDAVFGTQPHGGALTPTQSAPEGWPLWASDRSVHSVSGGCLGGDAAASSVEVRCLRPE